MAWLMPSTFAAVLAGWYTTEVGRQPYTVYGLLRTSDSLSNVDAQAIGAVHGDGAAGVASSTRSAAVR